MRVNKTAIFSVQPKFNQSRFMPPKKFGTLIFFGNQIKAQIPKSMIFIFISFKFIAKDHKMKVPSKLFYRLYGCNRLHCHLKL